MNTQSTTITTSLYLYGDDLDPDVVSSTLGIMPTTARRKGDTRITATNQKVVQKTGLWELTIDSDSEVLSDQLSDLLSKIGVGRALPSKIAGVCGAHVDVLICPSFDEKGGANYYLELTQANISGLSNLELPIRLTIGFTS